MRQAAAAKEAENQRLTKEAKEAEERKEQEAWEALKQESAREEEQKRIEEEEKSKRHPAEELHEIFNTLYASRARQEVTYDPGFRERSMQLSRKILTQCEVIKSSTDKPMNIDEDPNSNSTDSAKLKAA